MPRKPHRDAERLRRQQLTGQRIRQIRTEVLDLSQADFARALGFSSTSWVSAIEAGLNSIDAHDLQRIADLAGYPVEWFTNPAFAPGDMRRPRHRLDWEALYPDEPKRARLHNEIDQAFKP